jgi:sugar-specific transcriptional regulator TrmB
MRDDAIEGLTRLGLSAYEAKVFVGLHKLGTGSAGEVADVTDVPRSQVYGAAEGLEELGLIDVQEGTPTVYRPIPVSEARQHLYERVKDAGDTAFDYVESVAGEHADEEDSGESVWRTDGRVNVAQRAATMIREADERVRYGAGDTERLEESVLASLSAVADCGVQVTVTSADADVVAAARDAGLEAITIPDTATPDLSNGRVMVVDDDGVLLSVLPTAAMPHISRETGFWSFDTAFARMLVTLIDEWFLEHVPEEVAETRLFEPTETDTVSTESDASDS